MHKYIRVHSSNRCQHRSRIQTSTAWQSTTGYNVIAILVVWHTSSLNICRFGLALAQCLSFIELWNEQPPRGILHSLSNNEESPQMHSTRLGGSWLGTQELNLHLSIHWHKYLKIHAPSTLSNPILIINLPLNITLQQLNVVVRLEINKIGPTIFESFRINVDYSISLSPNQFCSCIHVCNKINCITEMYYSYLTLATVQFSNELGGRTQQWTNMHFLETRQCTYNTLATYRGHQLVFGRWFPKVTRINNFFVHLSGQTVQMPSLFKQLRFLHHFTARIQFLTMYFNTEVCKRLWRSAGIG